jgi:hypothetical protein
MKEEALFKTNRRPRHSDDTKNKGDKNKWWVRPTLINYTAQKGVH